YRVRNLGSHLKPKGLVTQDVAAADTESKDPNEEVIELIDPGVPPPKELYEKFKDFTDEVEVFVHKTDKLRFFPHFVLRSTEYDNEYLVPVTPAAIGPIKAREVPGRPDQVLHTSLTIGEAPTAKSDDKTDNSVWGVAMWTDIDPKIDYFVVYVQGLT